MQIGGKRRFGKSRIHNDELAAIHTLFFKPLHNRRKGFRTIRSP